MIRQAKREDIPQLQQLFALVFQKETTYSHWQWKYFHPEQKALSLVWEEEGEILGHYGGQEFPFVYKRKIVHAWAVTDIMTHPKVRWRLGKRAPLYQMGKTFIEETEKENAHFLFGFPGDVSRKYGERFLGYQTVFPVQWFIVKNQDLPSKPGSFQENPPSIPEKTYPGVLRTNVWKRWRFDHHPDEDYTIFSDTKGYIVVKPKNEEVLILEMGGKSSSWDSLIALALERFSLPQARGMASPGLLKKWKTKLSIDLVPAGFFFCLRPLKKVSLPWIQKHAFVQLSDYDVE